jgi:hypothetical protein
MSRIATLESFSVICGAIAIPVLIYWGDGKRLELRERNLVKRNYYQYYLQSQTHQDYLLLSEYAHDVSPTLDIEAIAQDFANKKHDLQNNFKYALQQVISGTCFINSLRTSLLAMWNIKVF